LLRKGWDVFLLLCEVSLRRDVGCVVGLGIVTRCVFEDRRLSGIASLWSAHKTEIVGEIDHGRVYVAGERECARIRSLLFALVTAWDLQGEGVIRRAGLRETGERPGECGCVYGNVWLRSWSPAAVFLRGISELGERLGEVAFEFDGRADSFIPLWVEVNVKGVVGVVWADGSMLGASRRRDRWGRHDVEGELSLRRIERQQEKRDQKVDEAVEH